MAGFLEDTERAAISAGAGEFTITLKRAYGFGIDAVPAGCRDDERQGAHRLSSAFDRNRNIARTLMAGSSRSIYKGDTPVSAKREGMRRIGSESFGKPLWGCGRLPPIEHG